MKSKCLLSIESDIFQNFRSFIKYHQRHAYQFPGFSICIQPHSRCITSKQSQNELLEEAHSTGVGGRVAWTNIESDSRSIECNEWLSTLSLLQVKYSVYSFEYIFATCVLAQLKDISQNEVLYFVSSVQFVNRIDYATKPIHPLNCFAKGISRRLKGRACKLNGVLIALFC